MPVTTALLTEEEIRQLPRWAMVAFAGRCARRASHMTVASRSNVGKVSIDPVVEQVELTAANANTTEYANQLLKAAQVNAEPAVRAAAMAAIAAQSAASSVRAISNATASLAVAPAVGTSHAERGARTAQIMYAAERDIAVSQTVQATLLVTETTAAGASETGVLIRRDFQKVLAACQAGEWTDETPVPWTVFEVLPCELVMRAWLRFRVLVDSNVPAETVSKHLSEIYRKLNGYLVEKHGTYLPAADFRRLVLEEAKRGATA